MNCATPRPTITSNIQLDRAIREHGRDRHKIWIKARSLAIAPSVAAALLFFAGIASAQANCDSNLIDALGDADTKAIAIDEVGCVTGKSYVGGYDATIARGVTANGTTALSSGTLGVRCSSRAINDAGWVVPICPDGPTTEARANRRIGNVLAGASSGTRATQ